MTLRRETCDARRLQRFLRNELPEDSQRDIEVHLHVCPACRDQLDRLAGGERWWTEVRRYLGGDGAAQPPPPRAESPARRPANVDLSFLLPSDHPASLGRLGAYEVLEVVGRGGMGVVVKAFDPALHRPVAIKVLAADYAANGAARKRFAREAQAAAAVSHDHVVPVHAVDADATPPYLVMSFIAGQSLHQRIDRSGPLELQEILRIGMQTAAGLAAAHAQGLVHRDIKPANIMLENGIERVRITDFGLARAVDDASVTQSGAAAGTPQYMAPEQAGGGLVDQRADLFALGSTLYAITTGQAPFAGNSLMGVIRQVCDTEPRPMRALNPAVPVWLEGIVQKLHRKDPAERFQSAAEVAELLERCLAHVQQPDHHPLPPLAEKLGRQVPSRRKARPLLRRCLAVVGVVIACAPALLLLPHPTEDREPVRPDSAVAEPDGSAHPDVESLDNDFAEGSRRVQAHLHDVQQGFSAGEPGGKSGLEPEFRRLGARAETLRHGFHAMPDADSDPVDVQLENLRRRLERLRQRIGAEP
jgi:serine/threonine protein kinase